VKWIRDKDASPSYQMLKECYFVITTALAGLLDSAIFRPPYHYSFLRLNSNGNLPHVALQNQNQGAPKSFYPEESLSHPINQIIIPKFTIMILDFFRSLCVTVCLPFAVTPSSVTVMYVSSSSSPATSIICWRSSLGFSFSVLLLFKF